MKARFAMRVQEEDRLDSEYNAYPHLQVIAEGIENQLQLEILREPGGNAVQGYLIGQPQTPRDIDRALEREIVRRDLHNSHP